MHELKRKLFFAIVLVLMIYVAGVLFYESVEGWNWVDSIYFMTATITTVGYGDIVPHTDVGKLMTAVFSWVGISIGFYLIFTISMYREAAFDPKLKVLIRKIRGEKEDKRDISKYMKRAEHK